jgi:PhnB protein
MKINAYLNFNGNCEEAFKFYEKALGAKPVMMMRYGESPAAKDIPKDMHSKIIHARIALGDDVIMGSDCPPDRFEGQHGFCLNIGVDTLEKAERYWNALKDKAEICMPFEETFWAERFGMLVDRFGIPWMVNCEKKM